MKHSWILIIILLLSTTIIAYTQPTEDYVLISKSDLGRLNADLERSRNVQFENKELKLELDKLKRLVDSLNFSLLTNEQKIVVWKREATKYKLINQQIEIQLEEQMITYETSMSTMRKYNLTMKNKLLRYEGKGFFKSGFAQMSTLASFEAVAIVVLLIARSHNY